jgi:hypothetical protein
MAAHDRDANPSAEGEGRHRAVIGVYYYEEPVAAATADANAAPEEAEDA